MHTHTQVDTAAALSRKLERWTVAQSHSGKWVVEDTQSPRAEDAVVYRFASRRKACAFVGMLVAEVARG
jgi:hypothetical protein